MTITVPANIAMCLGIPEKFHNDIRINWYEIDGKVFLGGTCFDHSGMLTDVLDIRLQVERIR